MFYSRKCCEKCFNLNFQESATSLVDVIFDTDESWILLHARDIKTENMPLLVPKFETTDMCAKAVISKDDIFGGVFNAPTLQNKDSDLKKSDDIKTSAEDFKKSKLFYK